MKMNRRQKRTLWRILTAAALFAAAELLSHFVAALDGIWSLPLFLIPYAVIGYDILWRAARNIAHGQVFDENFLMAIATIGAFFTGSFGEGVAVMLVYQIGELFQSCAVASSRRSIAALMDICPDSASVVTENGEIRTVDPAAVAVGAEIVVKPGEKIPIDGVVLDGTSTLNTAALTGESAPRSISVGDAVASGCINQEGTLRIRTTKPYGESTATKIVELVEKASERKARTENFITRFARWYTPAVVIGALLLAVLPPLILGSGWKEWIHRALIFLVISCPCALVISVPLSFFGGIGGASRAGILVKGGSDLEALSGASTVVFDKTGTLTEGSFTVTAVHPSDGSAEALLETAAHAEIYSDHPIARSVRESYGEAPDARRVAHAEEIAGRGVRAEVDGHTVHAGNSRLMDDAGAAWHACHHAGTTVHVARDGAYLGHIVISDRPKDDAAEAVAALRALGVSRTVMLTGDAEAVAAETAAALGIDEWHAGLLPADKVSLLESLLEKERGGRGKVVFVGDGINDAPVLMRADVGVAMGAMGSDAAIEAADVVLMDDRPAKIPQAIRIARHTMRIVYENIAFALGVKALILLLGALGVAGMWAAVFADVGVAVLAILNAMRALRVPQ